MKIHKAAKMRAGDFAISALCFLTPHPIDIRRASYTLDDERVTCKACLSLLQLQKADLDGVREIPVAR